MVFNDYLLRPELNRFIRRLTAGGYLFKQGETGKTTFIILKGSVQLFEEKGGTEHPVGHFGPGQFVGERALVSDKPYQRPFTAQAKNEVTVIEFSLDDLLIIQKALPDFLVMVLQSAAQRLDRANFLIRALRSRDDVQRFTRCILYLCRCRAQESGDATDTTFTADELVYLVEIDRKSVDVWLKELEACGAIVRRTNGSFVLRDEQTLLKVSLAFHSHKAAA